MKVLDYGAERKWQGLSALSVPLLPKSQQWLPTRTNDLNRRLCSKGPHT